MRHFYRQLLCLLLVALVLTSCSSQSNEQTTLFRFVQRQPLQYAPYGGEQCAALLQKIDELLTKDIAALQPGESRTVQTTTELREQYYDLAQVMRWDFLPGFAEGEPPQHIGAYIYLAVAQSLRWYWQPLDLTDPNAWPTLWIAPDIVTDRRAWLANGRENIMGTAASQIQAYIQTHFGVQVEAEPLNKWEFDGQYYILMDCGWAGPPMYRLTDLQLENRNGQIIYTATLQEYVSTGRYIGEEYPPNARQLVCSGSEETPNLQLYDNYWGDLIVSYYINPADGELFYLAVSAMPR